MQQTSLGWISKLRKSDATAWNELVDRHSPSVYRKCRRRGLRPDDAEDIVQQVFKSIHGKIDDFERVRDRAFRGWVATITHHAITDFLRKNARRPIAFGGSTALQMLSDKPDSLIGDDSRESDMALEISQRLDAVFGKFETKTIRVFEMLVIEGQSVDMVAAKFKMTSGAVRNAKYQVLKELRPEFDDWNKG